MERIEIEFFPGEDDRAPVWTLWFCSDSDLDGKKIGEFWTESEARAAAEKFDEERFFKSLSIG